MLRILHVSAQQLAGWERAGLIEPAETYSFSDLLQLKKLSDLRTKHVRPAVIRESLEAMQRQVSGLKNPLLEAGTFSTGTRVAFRHRGSAVEPIAGQFVLDFTPRENVVAAKVKAMPPAESAEEFFARGITLEEDPATHPAAIEAYKKALELDAEHAAAHINLGTLYYNRREYGLAEQHYRQAIEVDPRYALAYFDLGNVLDETGRLPEAAQAYRTALQFAPTYADAHYNLALAYEKMKLPRKALRHWQTYARMDASGPWAVHARAQIRRTLDAEKLKIVHRRRRR